MEAENRVENLDEEAYRSLGNILQGLVLDTVLFQSLTDIETPHCFVKLDRVD